MTLRTMCPEASRPLTIVFVPWNLMPLGANTKRACTLPEAEETTETTRAWLVPWRAMRVLPTVTVTVSGPSGAAGAAGAAGPAGAASGTSGAATGEVGAEMMTSELPAMSRKLATTRRRSPTSALPGMNMSPTTAPVTDSQTSVAVSRCQVSLTVGRGRVADRHGARGGRVARRADGGDGRVGELQLLDVPEGVDTVGAALVVDRDAAVRVVGDGVGVDRVAEHGRVGVRVRAGGQDLTHDPEVARVDVALEHGILQRRAREAVREGARECRVLHHVGGGDLLPTAIDEADPRGELAVAVDDVIGAATHDGVVAGAAEQDVAGTEDGAGDRAEARRGVRDDRCCALREGCHDRTQPGDAILTRLVEHVAAGEAGPAERVRGGVMPLDDVVEARAGVGLGLLPAVAVDDHLDRHADEVVVDL